MFGNDTGTKAEELIRSSEQYHSGLADMRSRYEEVRRYVRRDHWSNLVNDPDNPGGPKITERALIERKGRTAVMFMQMEAIRRNLRGQYRRSRADRHVFAVNRANEDAVRQVNLAMRGVYRQNRMPTLEVDGFEDISMSGAECWRIGIEFDPMLNRDEVRVDLLDVNRLFFNSDIRDRRLSGLRQVGYLHDFTIDQIVTQFAVDENGDYDEKKAEEIKDHYGDSVGTTNWAQYNPNSGGFYDTGHSGLYRVIEVWEAAEEVVKYVHDPAEGTQEVLDESIGDIASLNADRREAGMPELKIINRREEVWHYYYMSPHGFMLADGLTPYWHDSHPFVIGLLNWKDAETWGIYEAIIHPQRWLNRMMVLYDELLAGTAKGTLRIPSTSIPEDSSAEEIATAHSTPNSAFVYESHPSRNPTGAYPEQITRSSVPNEVFALLPILKDWIQEVSGAKGPISGDDPERKTTASQYQMQIDQGLLANLDIFESHYECLNEVDEKVVACMMQAYEEKRPLATEDEQNVIEFSLGKVQDSPTMRMMWDADLKELLVAGKIDDDTFYEFWSHPLAAQLKRYMQEKGGPTPEQLKMILENQQ